MAVSARLRAMLPVHRFLTAVAFAVVVIVTIALPVSAEEFRFKR